MQTHSTWSPGLQRPQLDHQALHVWRIGLDVDEVHRADRYVVEAPRRRFIRARAAMRDILARYLAIDPTAIVFAGNPHGKLHIEGHPVHFNLSHSGSWALLAVTGAGETGIDIEYMDPRRAGDDIAQRFFSPAEQQLLATTPEPEKTAAFFRIWSRKEAVIKSLGEGLACPLDSFDVSADPDRARLHAIRRDGLNASAWTMLNIDAHPAYAAAVAVIGEIGIVVGYDV